MSAIESPPLTLLLAAARHAPLVGRRDELQVFTDLWAEVERGRRQAIFIGGEPGIGKTRLLAEIAVALHDDGVPVLVGTAVSDPGIPYLPFVEMLDAIFSTDPGTSPDSGTGDIADLVSPPQAVQLARLSRVVAGRLGVDERAVATSDVRRDLFGAVSSLFRSLCAERPVAVLLEDLQWAQLPTLALLQHLVTTGADLPLLVVGTFRSSVTDRSADLAAVIAELHRLDGVRRLDLHGLDTDAIADYLQLKAGVPAQLARSPAADLRERTGGNAFLLRELWIDLERRGGIDALTRRPPGDPDTPPASIVDTLTARIDGMAARVRPVIELAAVMGTTFELDELLAASDDDTELVLAFVDEGCALGLIERVAAPVHRYAFVHALTRQAVLDRLAPSRLMRLHARVAASLETRADRPGSVPRLAHHLLAAGGLGDPAAAYHRSGEAGRLAEQGLAFEEAAQWYERAAHLTAITADERARAAFRAAADWVRAGRFPVARARYGELATTGDPLLRLESAIGYEDTNWRPGRPDRRAVTLIDDALREAIRGGVVDESDPPAVRALASLGRALTFAGEHLRSLDVGRRAIELARGLDDTVLVHALTTSLWHGIGPEMIEVQRARTTELATLTVVVGDHEAIGATANFRAMLAYLSGDPAGVTSAATDIANVAQSVGQPYFEHIHGCVMQAKAFLGGDFTQAIRWADEALVRNDMFGDDMTAGPHGVQCYLIARETGGLDAMRVHLSGGESFEGRWIPGLLALYTELGVVGGVERALARLTSGGIVPRPDQAQWPIELVFLVEAALALERVDLAEELREHVAAYDGCNLASGALVAVFGSANRYLARLDDLLGRDADAEAGFAAALEMDTTMGSTVHRAETLAHHAWFAQRRGDTERAAELVAEARRLAEPIGQVRVLRILDPIGVHHRPPATCGPGDLTGREVDVLRLIADGLSNREIGERLHISANTAANHVRSILTKTGAANRTQAAIFAARQEIV